MVSYWKIPFYKSFATNQQRIHLIQADSHAASTLYVIKRILNGNKLDFLFIDGDHSYEGVKKDFEMYGKLVGKGGTIAFHDICLHGVDRLWNEIKPAYRHEEMVKDWKQRGFGIGIVYV